MTDLKPCPFCDKGHTLKLITTEKMRRTHWMPMPKWMKAPAGVLGTSNDQQKGASDAA